ncbi:MAG: hypothetical protein COA58_01530 [Bacteroidetes bacterium]|nr:MAG: hypothetical protein COA58_01530 [Bacteroidota bacterium]
MSSLKILCLGPLWRGSNAGALFKAFSRNGSLISVVDEFYHIPLKPENKLAKIIGKLSRKQFVESYNQSILNEFYLFKPDLVLVYKGAFVYPETVESMKVSSKVVCFYPDVSFHTHGGLLRKTLPLYETVFTTKTFGVDDMNEQLGQKNGVFIPHGFDPEIHREFDITPEIKNQFECDASFIGTWSSHKEKYLKHLVKSIPSINLKIWGGQWNKSSGLDSYVMNTSVNGDLYAIAIQCSKINVALLSEKVKGTVYGDRITSRTFQIPAVGGFMLHQDSNEIGKYFSIGNEIDTFKDPNEFVSKVEFYLSKQEKRDEMRVAAQKKAKSHHSLDNRALEILKMIK